MSFVSPPVQATGDLLTAATWNSNFSWLYDTGWLSFGALGFLNSWVNVAGPGGGQSGYRKTGNVVRLAGTVAGGASGTSICNVLPAGYRPTVSVTGAGIMTATATNPVVWNVSTGGGITLIFPGGTVPSCDGVTWTVD